jgi:multisubunit Na+/H+ antiporter MnhC subunit
VSTLNPVSNPLVDYARALIGVHIDRLKDAQQRRDTGASAIELAIITAILVGLAVAVLVIVNTIVTNRKNEIIKNNGGIT